MGSIFRKQGVVRMIVIVVALLLVVGLVGGVLAATKTSSGTSSAKTSSSLTASTSPSSSNSGSSSGGSDSGSSGGDISSPVTCPTPSVGQLIVWSYSTSALRVEAEYDKDVVSTVDIVAGCYETININPDYTYYIVLVDGVGSFLRCTFEGKYQGSTEPFSPVYYDGNFKDVNNMTDWTFQSGDYGVLCITTQS